jgi:hypothetical protein
MRTGLRQQIKRFLPFRLQALISSVRWWGFVEEASVRSGLRDLCQRVISCCGTTVLYGPFSGLQLTREGLLAVCNTAALLGTYELELHPWLYDLRPGKYNRVLDIGAADGYYAAGMALRTGQRVDAYDTAPRARHLCRLTAKSSGHSRLVRIHSLCSRRALLRLNGQRCFILSDCEGFEISLFSDDVIRALAYSDLIIELHDGAAPFGTARKVLEPRFAMTHKVEFVRFKPRNWKDFPELACLRLLGEDASRAISEEGRGDQEWLIATPL